MINFRLGLLFAIILVSGEVRAQKRESFEPTSATDGEVKLNKSKFRLLFTRPKTYGRANEKPGSSIKRPKSKNRNRSWNEAKVFHRQPAKKSKSSRSRAGKKQMLSRN